MTSAIHAQGIGKRYVISHQAPGRYRALRDVVAERAARLARRLAGGEARAVGGEREEFWALRDVSFEIGLGERVGIIGRNGAGKSTLLKILSRITPPSAGRVILRGRVASLLEVGTGFHPELTGRENIFLNGAILGMGKAEIRTKFDEIVDFAGIERFLDTPVKRYSSGMYVRLAFAVAAHIEPEILLVDEVLAVGDAEFQRKCIGRMEEVSRSGRTILFVSHNFAAIQRLCGRAILLDAGTVRADGGVAEVLKLYQDSLSGTSGHAASVEVKEGQARFAGWEVSADETAPPHACYSRDECRFRFTLICRRRVTSAYFGFAIWDEDGALMFACSSLDGGKPYLELAPGAHEVGFRVRLPLKAGRYALDVSLNSLDAGQLDRYAAAPRLAILPRLDTTLPETWHGLLNEPSQFELAAMIPERETT